LITKYNLYPGDRVFVDGQSDFYEQDFEQKYFEVLEVNYDWEQSLNRYKWTPSFYPPRPPWPAPQKSPAIGAQFLTTKSLFPGDPGSGAES
jgi:hypothetical protein